MPLKSILFLGIFAACVVGALFNPLVGILAYVFHYSIGPERQWWAGAVRHLGIRYIYTLALVTAISMAIHFRELRYGTRFLLGHEKWILVFLGAIWLSVAISPATVGRYTTLDHPSVKFTKVVIFVFMMTHVVTTEKRMNLLLWVLIAGAFVLGWQAYDTPYRQFLYGRLERVGGPDFAESNVLAAYLACMLPIIGLQFARTGWAGKLACLVAGAFATNAIVLTRSRTPILGLGAAGILAIVFAPRQYRLWVVLALVVFMAGGLYLSDPQFLDRASTVFRPTEERDASSRSRLEIWSAASRMLRAKPLGVGIGNFHQTIGRYAPEYEGRDAHNTYLRCACELGIQGIASFGVVIASAFWLLRRTVQQAVDLPEEQRKRVVFLCYGLALSIAAILACGITITLLYVEALWWVLALPLCAARVVENMKADAAGSLAESSAAPEQEAAPARPSVVAEAS
jgi:O-antigen ligase